MLRLTDMLLTETPRPCLDDEPFTRFAEIYGDNPTVIETTQCYTLFVQLAMNNQYTSPLHDALVEELGDTTGSQVADFFDFDWRSLGCLAPPYEQFVIEVDHREGMAAAARAEFDMTFDAKDLLHVGKTAAAFLAVERDSFEKVVSAHGARLRVTGNGLNLRDFADLDFRWVYVVTIYRYSPGFGLIGPSASFFIPLNHEGELMFVQGEDQNIPAILAMGPTPPGPSGTFMPLDEQYALAQGWTVLVPALFALSLMHTPRATKQREGYHAMVEGDMPKERFQRKYLEKNFRPLTRWYSMDIEPLREAIKRENGGTFPSDMAGLRKALHTVRGHSATYLPNTYFGRKHDQPITVFRPSYVRGDARSGVVQKDLRVTL